MIVSSSTLKYEGWIVLSQLNCPSWALAVTNSHYCILPWHYGRPCVLTIIRRKEKGSPCCREMKRLDRWSLIFLQQEKAQKEVTKIVAEGEEY